MRGVLKELAPDACVIDARDGRRAMELIEDEPQLDLLLLDLHLPDQDGFTMLSNLRECRPEISIVVLSASQDRETVRRALGLGALGFIPKNTEREVVLSALRLVLAGGLYIPVEALDRAEPGRIAEARKALPDNVGRRLSGALGLTERQMDVLALVMEGKSNKAISRAL